MKSQNDPLSNWKRPRIVVRKRTLNEQRDLAICIACQEFKSLWLYYVVLAIPVLLVDYAFWWGLTFFYFDFNFDRLFFPDNWPWTVTLSFLLVWTTVTLETSFIGSLTTQYLGLWLFSDEESIRFKHVVKSWRTRLFQTFYYLVATRLIRLRSFYAETIFLERTPFLKSEGRFTTSKRVRLINSGGVGIESICFFFGTELYVISGAVSALLTLYYATKVIVGDATISLFFLVFFFVPVVTVSCRYFNVIYNFCRYVNYRIVSEGWDVDLSFKAELSRLDDAIKETSFVSEHSRGVGIATLTIDSELDSIDSVEKNLSDCNLTAANHESDNVTTSLTIEKGTSYEK